MTEELKLKGATLRVFALIYSFSSNGLGEFNGSRTYLAKTVGASLRTVDTALKRLLDLGFIVKRKTNEWKASIYTVAERFYHKHLECDADESADAQTEKAADAPKKQVCASGCENDTGEAQKLQGGGAVPAYNNSEYIQEIVRSISTTNKRAEIRRKDEARALLKESEELCDPSLGIPVNDTFAKLFKLPMGKYRIRYYGYDENVPLSALQYEHLYSLVGRELDSYLDKMSDMISAPQKSGLYPHSCYRTILRWIRDDFGDETVAVNDGRIKKRSAH